MEDLQQQVLGVLNDPEKLSQVMDLAKGLGFSPPEAPSAEGAEPQPKLPQESSRATLLKALATYLKPERRKRLERAVELAQLSELARFALQNPSEPEVDASDV